jgi:hypothetical protein
MVRTRNLALLAAATACLTGPASGGAQDADAAPADAEYYVAGDGDDPWPEMTQPKPVRRVVRRGNSNDGQYSGPPLPDDRDVYEDYLQSLTYTKPRLPLRKPPGMLVVDYDQFGENSWANAAPPPPPQRSMRIGEIAPNATAGPPVDEQRPDALPPEDQPADPERRRPVGYSFGGSSVNDAEAPWQAQIYYPNIADEWRNALKQRVPLWALQHFCGGALIADNWVLTAAHCIDDGMRRNGYRVRLGQEDVSLLGGYTYKIEQVVVFSGYRERANAGDLNDIALIRIRNDTGHPTPLKSQVSPIPLYRAPAPAANQPLTVYGWGRTNSSSAFNAHAFLMKVGLRVMPENDCKPFGTQLNWVIDTTVICAKAPPKTARKTCKGDSGGPVVAGGKLLAVVSGGGARCAGDNMPSIFTRVGAYLPWIDRVTGRAAG